MFGLSATRVSEIVGQMITNEHLPAKIDKEFKIVTVKKESKMSRLELLANQYSEKLNSLVETNEKLTEAKASADEKKKKNKR
jgi:translation initiation factor 3 subunit C